jgi:hypothetical protein
MKGGIVREDRMQKGSARGDRVGFLDGIQWKG